MIACGREAEDRSGGGARRDLPQRCRVHSNHRA